MYDPRMKEKTTQFSNGKTPINKFLNKILLDILRHFQVS